MVQDSNCCGGRYRQGGRLPVREDAIKQPKLAVPAEVVRPFDAVTGEMPVSPATPPTRAGAAALDQSAPA
jgi:hypothetical protein